MKKIDPLSIRHRLAAHLAEIVRDRNPYLNQGDHFWVQCYIRQQFEQLGTVTTHEFDVRGRTHTNWIVNLPFQPVSNRDQNQNETRADAHSPAAPSKRQNRPILIGAHYDTVPGSPGADDNASGVAVLFELGRLLTEFPSNWPVRLVAFDMEEYGLSGSRAYAAHLKRQRQKLRLMLGLEMLGYRSSESGSQSYPLYSPGLQLFYPDQGDFIGLIGNLRAIPDLRHLSRAMRQAKAQCYWLPVPLLGWAVPDTRRSDHSPFWDRGDRAIMVTDTANLRNPNYHKPSDTLDTLDLDFLTQNCLGLFEGIRTLA
ncbi:MAG: M28 family peptidase [Thainema sp.]